MNKLFNVAGRVALVTGVAAGMGLAAAQAFAEPDAIKRSNQMKIKVGATTFIASLEDNATTKAFKAMLPMTVRMSDLNANEKLFRLPESLPTNEANPETIQTGDLMLYGSKTLVLFYKTFPTAYSYTRLGRVTDTTGLAAALGSQNVTVTYQME
jgi:hypothetical protein